MHRCIFLLFFPFHPVIFEGRKNVKIYQLNASLQICYYFLFHFFSLDGNLVFFSPFFCLSPLNIVRGMRTSWEVDLKLNSALLWLRPYLWNCISPGVSFFYCFHFEEKTTRAISNMKISFVHCSDFGKFDSFDFYFCWTYVRHSLQFFFQSHLFSSLFSSLNFKLNSFSLVSSSSCWFFFYFIFRQSPFSWAEVLLCCLNNTQIKMGNSSV